MMNLAWALKDEIGDTRPISSHLNLIDEFEIKYDQCQTL